MKLTMEILKVLNERHFIEGQICKRYLYQPWDLPAPSNNFNANRARHYFWHFCWLLCVFCNIQM